MSYLRMLAYTIIVVGLIIILPEAILLLSIDINPLHGPVTLRAYSILWLGIALVALAYAFLN